MLGIQDLPLTSSQAHKNYVSGSYHPEWRPQGRPKGQSLHSR